MSEPQPPGLRPDNRFHSAVPSVGEVQLHVPLLTCATVAIRHPTPADEAEFLAKARRSRALHLRGRNRRRRGAVPPFPRDAEASATCVARLRTRRRADRRRRQRQRDRARLVPQRVSRLLRVRRIRAARAHARGPRRRRSSRVSHARLHRLEANIQPAIAPRWPRQIVRVREGRLFAPLSEDRRPLARPRALGNCRLLTSGPTADRDAMLAATCVGDRDDESPLAGAVAFGAAARQRNCSRDRGRGVHGSAAAPCSSSPTTRRRRTSRTS